MTPIPRLTQLSGLVWRILGCNPGPMTLQGTNVYLVGSGPKRVLIDAGQDGFPEYVNNLTKLLTEQSVIIDKIVITHWHQDHIGALKDLRDSIFSKIVPLVYKFPRKDVPDPPLPEGYGMVESLQDNQVISTGDATLRILFTPGHTTDHAALYLEEEKAIFSGDCILGDGTTVFEDLHDYMLSLERLKRMEASIIYPGHGPVVGDPKEKITFYLNHRMERERQILNVLKSSITTGSGSTKKRMTSMDIVKIVYKDVPVHLHPAAERNVEHHLEKLLKQKRVQRRESGYFLIEDTKL